MPIKADYIGELEKRHGSSPEIDELRRRYAPESLKSVTLLTPEDSEERAKESLGLASDLGLSIDEAERHYPQLSAGKEDGRLSELFQRYVRDPITEHTGLFPYVTDFGDPRHSDLTIGERLSELKTELPAALLHVTAENVSGLGLSAPDILAQEFDRYILNSDKPVTTLAGLVDRITDFDKTNDKELQQSAEITGKLFKFLGGLKTARKLLGPLMNRLPVRESLRTIFGVGLQFGTVTTAEELSLAVTEGKDVDWNAIHKSMGWGVVFGGAESLVGKLLQYKDVSAAIKWNPQLKSIPRSLLNKVAEAGRAKAGGMTRGAWNKVYGEDAQQFVNHLRRISEIPLLGDGGKPVVEPVRKVKPVESKVIKITKPVPTKPAKATPTKPTRAIVKKPTAPTEGKVQLRRATPPIGGRDSGFVDLTPLADAGTQIRTISEEVTKVTTRFTGLDAPVRKAFIEYEEQIKELPKIAANISQESGFADLTKEQEQLLENFVEQADKFPDKFPEELPTELAPAYLNLTRGLANAKARLNDIGVAADWPEGQIKFLKEKLTQLEQVEQPDEIRIAQIEKSIEDLTDLNYLHHAYSKTPNESIKRWFGQKKITRRPVGLLGRKFPTLESAEAEGFVRAPLAVSYADMWHKVMRAEQADALIKAINDNPNLSMWAEEAPSDWVTVPEEIFPASRTHSTYTEGGKIKHRVRTRKYPAPVADALLELTYTRGTHAIEKAYDKFNLTMKLVGFYNPVVMGKNDAVQMWRASGAKGFVSLPKAMKTFLAKGSDYHKLRKGGLFNNVVNYGPSVEVLAQNMVDHVRLTSGEKAARTAAKWLNPKNFLQNLSQVQQSTTWNMDEVIRIATYHAVEDSGMLEGLSEFEKIEWVNDAMVNYGKLPKETKRWLTKVAYVPTYRIGNFRFWWGTLAKHPWKFKGPILRTLGYKTFIQWGLPAMVASIIAFKTKRRFDEVKGDVFVERGYRLVIHNPENNSDTVYALSDPLLEGAKLSQREFRRTLELNMAAAPAFLLRVLRGRKRTASEDPLGEFFKLGTPFYRDIVTATSKDKNKVQKMLTHLAIAFTYKRQGREKDKVNMYDQAARTLSVWTDWQAQKADLKAIWTGKSFFYGPNGEFGRLIREFEADRKIEIAKTDKEIDIALAQGKNKDAVRIAFEDERYKSTGGLSDRFLRWHQPLAYLDKTMSKDNKRAFVKWLKEDKKMSDKDLAKLADAIKVKR